MKQKTHILFIHGGMTFKTKKEYLHYLETRDISIEKKVRWHQKYLSKRLGKSCDIIQPRMPLSDNATYKEWKIHFERYLPLLRNNCILIGVSLGGIFLAKYLSEHAVPKKFLSTYLICPPFDNTLPGEDLAGGFHLKSDLSLLPKNTKHLTLMFSQDDDVVPVAHAEKYRKKLPQAHIMIYNNKQGHFKVATFPELVNMIQKDIQKKRNG